MADPQQESADDPKQQQPSFSSRRLESFPAPDLEVLVGPKDRIYRYHSLMLASHSGFVDRVLSSPMGIRNQEQRRVEFPDIEEDTWEMMMSFLEPGGSLRALGFDGVEKVLPFYEKYQFVDGLRLLDDFVHVFLSNKNGYIIDNVVYDPEPAVKVAVMSFNMSHSMPKSSKAAVVWAKKVLRKMTAKKEDTIRDLLPLVENDELMLQTLVMTIKGRHYRDMRVDEMRSLARAETFASEILLKTKQIDELEKIMKQLQVKEVILYSSRPTSVLLKNVGSRPNDEVPERGAMRYVYKGENQHEAPGQFMVLEGMDPFGLVWEISVHWYENNSENEEDIDDVPSSIESKKDRDVLYRWDCGYSSLFPPKDGWQAVDEASNKIPQLQYELETKPSYF